MNKWIRTKQKYIWSEIYWANGINLFARFKHWTKWDLIKQTLLTGGIMKLTFFPTLAHFHFWIIDLNWVATITWTQIFIITIVWAYASDIISIILGRWNFLKGLVKEQSEIGQKNKVLNPFNEELKMTLREICEKMEIKSHFTDENQHHQS